MARSFVRASSQYLENTDSAPLSTYPVTVSAWYNITSASTGYALCSIQDKDVTNSWFFLRIKDLGATSAVNWWVRSAGALPEAQASTTTTANVWQHACGMSGSATDHAAFMNGGNKGTSAVNVTPTNLDSVSIARVGDSSPGDYLDGDLAEVAIWNAKLADLEVQLIYQGYPPWLIRPRSLVGFWLPFGEYNDRDYTRRHHMAAFNTPTWTNTDPHHIASFRARAQFEPFASSRRRMKHGRYPGSLITRPWANVPAAAAGAIMNQIQFNNLGADLYNGALIG